MKTMRNLIWLFIFGTFLITGCNNDDEPVNNGAIDLVGEWTATNVSVSMTVDGTPLAQWLQEAMDLSDAEAQEYADLFAEEMSGMTGTITFNEDNTYTAHFGDDPEESGTWEFINNNQTLILTEGDDDSPMELNVITLTETTLKVGIEEVESEDMNDDGTKEDLVINMELTFEK